MARLQNFWPMGAQLSMKAALPLAESIASNIHLNTRPWFVASATIILNMLDKGVLVLTWDDFDSLCHFNIDQ